MSKKILSICLATVLIFSVFTVFYGCGNTETGEIAENRSTTVPTTAEQTTKSQVEADSVEALEELIIETADNVVSELETEYADLLSDITTYNKYVKNADKVEEFYEKVIKKAEQLSIKLCEFSVTYAEILINSNMPYDDIYDELDGIYDCIYDDAGDVLYDDIYDGILDEIYDDFYAGIIEDGMESTTYSEWADVRSDAYKMWADARSDCYEIWADVRSEIYNFWSDIRSDIFGDDIDDAKKTIEKFEKKIQKMYGKSASSEETTKEKETATETTKPTTTEKTEELIDGMHPDFKAAMDSYEAFMTEYVDFMKKYEKNPDDFSLLMDYTNYMSKYSDFVEDFEDWDDEEMNSAEAAYYIDVQARVNKKLLEVAE